MIDYLFAKTLVAAKAAALQLGKKGNHLGSVASLGGLTQGFSRLVCLTIIGLKPPHIRTEKSEDLSSFIHRGLGVVGNQRRNMAYLLPIFSGNTFGDGR